MLSMSKPQEALSSSTLSAMSCGGVVISLYMSRTQLIGQSEENIQIFIFCTERVACLGGQINPGQNAYLIKSKLRIRQQKAVVAICRSGLSCSPVSCFH